MVLEIYDAKTKALQTKDITCEQLGLPSENESDDLTYLIDMDLVDENHYVFQWVSVENKGEEYYQTSDRRIYTDLSGESTQIELWDTYKDLGMTVGESYDQSFVPVASCLCDGLGNTYHILKKDKEEHIIVLNNKAELLLDYKIPVNWELVDQLRNKQDEVIYLIKNEKEQKYSFLWLDLSEKKAKELVNIETKEIIIDLCGMTENVIYYETAQGKVYAWNVENGNRSLLLDCQENGIISIYKRVYIVGDEMIPQIRIYHESNAINEKVEEWIAFLTKEKNENTVQIGVLVGDDGGFQMLSEMAAYTTKRNPNCLFNCEKISNEDEKKILTNQLIAGNGPDVLYVSREYFMTLAEKGTLLDVAELLDSKELGNILPGALELGTYENKLRGLPLFVSVSGILISDAIWDKDQWNFDDMLNLMKEHKLEESAFYINSGTSFAPLASARILIMRSIHEPWLIDWENRVSHFTDERFVSFLTLLKQEIYETESTEWLDQGKRLAILDLNNWEYVNDFGSREEKEQGHYVGFPTEKGSGNYLDTEGILVFNSNSSNQEVMKELLLSILKEGQSESGSNGSYALPITKMSVESLEHDTNGKYYLKGKEVQNLENGDSSLEACERFLESCVAAPLRNQNIENIIMEEIPAFFQGDKDVNEVADNIQNRVQLYLDEGK